MVLFQNWYSLDPEIGNDLQFVASVFSTASLPEIPGGGIPGYRVGARTQGIGGSEWMFVQASTTVTALNVVAIDNNFKANNITSALAASQVYSYGIAHFKSTLADGGTAGNGDFFWALMLARGGFSVQIVPSATRGAQLYIAALTPGALTATAAVTAQTAQVNNIVIVTAAGTSSGVTAEFVMVGYIKVTASV